MSPATATATATATSTATSATTTTRLARNVSGRDWKASAVKASLHTDIKTLHEGFAKRQQKLVVMRQAKAIEKELRAQAAEAKLAAKAERKRRIEQKMANEKRCEQVQVITNAAKLKRLSKKKMRGIQKR